MSKRGFMVFANKNILGLIIIIISYIMLQQGNLFSEDLVYEKLKKDLKLYSDDQINALSDNISGSFIKWSGWVYKIQRFDNEVESVVYVDMEAPDKKHKDFLPDIYFFIPYQTSLKLVNKQKITFTGRIEAIEKITNSYFIKVARVSIVD
jgi:hypothetical protein